MNYQYTPPIPILTKNVMDDVIMTNAYPCGVRKRHPIPIFNGETRDVESFIDVLTLVDTKNYHQIKPYYKPRTSSRTSYKERFKKVVPDE